jgi:hypothetical protein
MPHAVWVPLCGGRCVVWFNGWQLTAHVDTQKIGLGAGRDATGGVDQRLRDTRPRRARGHIYKKVGE